MPVRVLVVDDSSFFCRRVTEILGADSEIKVIGVANTGAEAVKKAGELKPDVITMDVEMPVMDGISATRQIMQQSKDIGIVMLSSLTYEGARATLDALAAGAADFVLKSYEDVQGNQSGTAKLLREKVRAIGEQIARRRGGFSPPAGPTVGTAGAGAAPQVAPSTPPSSLTRTAAATTTTTARPATPASAFSRPQPAPAPAQPAAAPVTRRNYKLVAIGSSTGGPVALQHVLQPLPKNFPAPIVIAQHMPGTFTPAFAQRLNGLCQIEVREARDGDLLQPGLALLAPGGKQMTVEGNGSQMRVRVRETDARLHYAPCVDVLFGSAANVCGNNMLAVILTGMGADGREGSRLIRARGGQIWSQDEASCVVYGMPMAVATAGLSHHILPLMDIGKRMAQEA